MFGHVHGAFTGAIRDKEGLLETANGGTLFLDEITEMPAVLQAKLLRVIQDGVVRRIGSNDTDAVVNVRFIAATNRNLKRGQGDDVLRSDLFYRLCVVPIHIPALRERPEDIPVLAEHFLARYWAQHRQPGEAKPVFGDSAMELLRSRAWPGNVRELQNVIEHAVVLLEPGGRSGMTTCRTSVRRPPPPNPPAPSCPSSRWATRATTAPASACSPISRPAT
jgi:transcriptional regulator with GAF, ATPase, and Fis domain